ncbi:MAG: tRNA 2-thiocytidine biosynthesis TtcA family protein [Paludibacteraceae bacterium]|nr:tRNA 2-thiocytidine biosynthesis TtcA family protein [Paludibacteraceae bacterium]
MTDDTFVYHLRGKFSKALKDYALIEDGDKVLIGLSGGKDSLALVDFFAERMKIFKPKFTVEAAHIIVRNIPYQSDIEYLKNYCSGFNIPLHIVETEFDQSTDTRKSPCFLCSWNRRKKLFETASGLGCTKIALGHHQDDIIETLLMNLTFQGAFATMPPLLKMKKMDFSIIRPLCLIRESELQRFASIKGFKKQIKNCPYENDSNRADMKALLSELEKLNKDARYSIWGAMQNIQMEYLPKKDKPSSTSF